MPARIKVSDEQIIAAGVKLVAGGQAVLPWALARAVGNGSPARLKAVWDAYTAKEAPAFQLPLPLPPLVEEAAAAMQSAMQSALSDAVRAIWETCERVASDRLQAEVADARRAAEEAMGELAVAAETLAQRDLEAQRAAEHNDVLRQMLSDARSAQHAWRGRAEAAETQQLAAFDALQIAALERSQLLQCIETAGSQAAKSREDRKAV